MGECLLRIFWICVRLCRKNARTPLKLPGLFEYSVIIQFGGEFVLPQVVFTDFDEDNYVGKEDLNMVIDRLTRRAGYITEIEQDQITKIVIQYA